MTLNTAIETVMKLDFTSREMLLEILKKRQSEERRKEIVKNASSAKKAYKTGKLPMLSANELIKSLDSLD